VSEPLLLVAAGAVTAGFVTGLAGFGVGIVALGFWLHAMDPLVAAPLVAVCSVAGQLQSIYPVRRSIVPGRIWPMVAGGLVGLPIGIVILTDLDARSLKVALGGLLVAYSAFGLLVRIGPVCRNAGRWADGGVGLVGGVLGGIAGVSGPPATIWTGLRGWTKDEQRAVYQPYNLVVLAVAVGAYATQGLLTAEVGWFAAIAVPALVLGVQGGMIAYKRIDEPTFRRVVLALLLISGVSLVANNLL
jgi:uncharacterized membrane protein YfcA